MKQNSNSFKEHICISAAVQNSPENQGCQMITTAASGDKIRAALNSFLPLDLSDFYFTTIQNGEVSVWAQSDPEYAEKNCSITQSPAGQNTITLE